MSPRDTMDSKPNEPARRRSPRESVFRFFAYAGLIWVLLLVPDFAFRWSLNMVLPSWTDYSGLRRQPSLYAKVAQYRAERDRYDLVFTGDSRTFTDMAPDRIDEILGTRSINVAIWGNWFPTQYPSNQDWLPFVPDGVPVVWSIGHVNFKQINEQVNVNYHIGFANLPDYLRWGFHLSRLRSNLIDGFPGLALYARRAYLREHVQRRLARRLWQNPDLVATATPVSDAPYRDLYDAVKSEPGVGRIEVIRDGDTATSLAAFKIAGNYVRYEIDHEFFRSKQRELAAQLETIATDRFEPSPQYWNLFLAILDQYQENGIHLIVNEFEEAPFHYEDPKNARLYREFMDEVRRLVEARGIPFIRVDFSRLGNEHYFDYNHLNSEGVEIFTEMFARELSPYLDGG